MKRTLLPLLVPLLLSCGSVVHARTDKAAGFYEDALNRLEKQDEAGAIIQLKNALQIDPRMLSAHLLLGRAYLKAGQPDAAQESLETAQRFGADRSQVALLLARAMVDQGKAKEVLDRFPPEVVPSNERVELLVVRGEAYRQQADFQAATQSYETARAFDPTSITAALALADAYARQGREAEAIRLADEAVTRAPTEARVWYTKGSVLHAARNFDGALAGYAQAVKLEPKHVDARLARISLLFDLGREEEALPDLDYLKKEVPREPRAAYYRALNATRKGDAKTTHESLTEVTALLDPVPPDVLRARAPELLMIGALAHHGLNEPEKAIRYLEAFLQGSPGSAGARKLLASIYVGRKDYTRAIDILEVGQRYAPKDPQLLALLASAYMAVGKNQLAARFLERAMESGGGSPEVNATLGFNLVQSGQQDLGMQYLQKAFDKDPGRGNLGASLAALYIRRGEHKKALAVADKLLQSHPNDALVLNMAGAAKAAMGDRAGARAAYEKAVKLDSRMTAARLNLAKLDLAERNFDAARTRLLALNKEQSKDPQPMYELARLESAAGRPAEAIRWLERLRASDTNHVAGGLLLAELFMHAEQPRKALEVLQGLQPVAPNNLDVNGALAAALVINDDKKGAQTILARMTRVAEFDPAWQYRIAQLQVQAGNTQGALYSLDKALESNTKYLPARVLQAEIDVSENRLDQAEARARALLVSNPAEGEGYRLLGDIAVRRGKFADAAGFYRTALGKSANTPNALRVYNAVLASGEGKAATSFLETWVKSHPDDQAASQALAEGHMRQGNLQAARSRYESLLKTAPEAPSVLNNLAIISDRLGDGAKAVEYAQRAVKAAPGDPRILDTLGWLLVRRGDPDAGLKHLREARVRDPRNPEIRFHLASALALGGRNVEARQELTLLLADSPSFPGAGDARALLKELGG